MNKAKALFEKSKKNHSLVYDSVSYAMYKLGYGDINLAGANSRYKTFTRLEKEFRGEIGKKSFKTYDDDMSNTVWICWLQGIESAPELVKNCVNSIQYYIKDRDFVFINKDNFRDYCEIPEFIIEKWEKGIISNTHFSDILRLALLIQHGGLWLDSTVYMTGALPDYITDCGFFAYRDGFFNCDLINIGNWLIFSKPNNTLLNETLSLIYSYWKKYNHTKHYFIFQMFFRMVTDYYEEEWEAVPYFSQMDQHIFSFELFNKYSEKRWKQLKALTPIHKLTNKLDISKAEEGSYYSLLDRLYKL